MSETYASPGLFGSSVQRATVGEAATGTHGQEFMRDDITKFADKTRFLDDNGFLNTTKIIFPATQVPSAGVNDLDDYEEGTFTPGITLGGAAVGLTYSTQVGSYTKIGNRVCFNLFVALTAKGSSVGTLVVTGLPFTSNATAGRNHQCASYGDGIAGITGTVKGYVPPNSSSVTAVVETAGAVAVLSNANLNNTSAFMYSGHYDV